MAATTTLGWNQRRCRCRARSNRNIDYFLTSVGHPRQASAPSVKAMQGICRRLSPINSRAPSRAPSRAEGYRGMTRTVPAPSIANRWSKVSPLPTCRHERRHVKAVVGMVSAMAASWSSHCVSRLMKCPGRTSFKPPPPERAWPPPRLLRLIVGCASVPHADA